MSSPLSPEQLTAAVQEREALRRRFPDGRCSDGCGSFMAAGRRTVGPEPPPCEWLTGVLQAGVFSRLEFCARCGVVRVPPKLLPLAIELSKGANG